MTKVKIKVRNDKDAFELVSALAAKDGQFALFSGDCKECVDAKSYLGVLYFMVVHPDDTYLFSESGFVPEKFKENG